MAAAFKMGQISVDRALILYIKNLLHQVAFPILRNKSSVAFCYGANPL